MKTILLATAASVAALISQAQAQEPLYDWTGVYIGAHAGAGLTLLDLDHDGDEYDSTADGFLGGVHAGYDWQSQSFVYGIMGDFDYVGQSIDEDPAVGPFGKVDNYTYDVDWVATARVRAGFAMDRTMVFASGGVGVAGIDVTARVAPFLGVPVTGRSSDVEIGGVLGLGIEHAFAGNWSVRGEYTHYFFDGIEVAVPDGPATFNPSFGALKLGISYRF